MQPLPHQRQLPGIRPALYWALALLACAMLTWGLLQACERAGAVPWSKAMGPDGTLADRAAALALHGDDAVPAGALPVLVEQASAWAPDLKAHAPAVELPAPTDMEFDQPDHALPPPALAYCLAPPSAWTPALGRGIDLAPAQGLLRPPDLG